MPPFTIHLHIDARYAHRVRPRVLRAAVRAALRQQHAPAPAALTLRLTGEAQLRRLNRDFMGHDAPTDVLSFPAEEPGYLGDLALSVPRAAAQARAGGHPLQAELQLLVVHGVLHLLGHDHRTARQKRRMWTAQAEILRQLNAPLTAPALLDPH